MATASYVRSPAESDEYTNVGYEAQTPRRRDFWRVLLGCWQPEVRRVEHLTLKGYDRVIREVWSSDKVREAWLAPDPLLRLGGTDGNA